MDGSLVDKIIAAGKHRPDDGLSDAVHRMVIKKAQLMRAAKEYAEAQAEVDAIDEARRARKEKELADANV